jgi:hypothetical protein
MCLECPFDGWGVSDTQMSVRSWNMTGSTPVEAVCAPLANNSGSASDGM